MVQDATYRRYIYVRHLSSDELWAFDAECYEFWHRAWDLEFVRRIGLWRPPRGGPSREEEPYQVRGDSKDSREFEADGVGSVVTKAHGEYTHVAQPGVCYREIRNANMVRCLTSPFLLQSQRLMGRYLGR